MAIIILFTGLGSMGDGGEFDEKHGTQLMFARVVLEGLTLLRIYQQVEYDAHGIV
ncbi:MAG: hypothetical protein GWO08_04760 [Gammaproteobacteria bacterium]|nr:hypothetical protein [Gammaproteobacteria bacterium]NIN62603.1 hypothetical protein [Gammaproteobacteria bacterium]NIO63147.1 hypothetical protein [Gammaproteobacteria bacterium]NIP48981.1 hypothetical protein [Gammaproteobacteria bacterium]NIQ09436.1 hypothetical protein [Gammaproteobacteria bacterium]